ncbi:MAG TPA: hypothetical protein VF168_12420 [Trueperaceae bacterium]
MAQRIRYLVSLLVLIALTACGGQGGGPLGERPVLTPPTTQVLDEGERNSLVAVEADGTLLFSVAPSLEAGDVVVSEPTAAAPHGLLRKVTAVREEGGMFVVETDGAELRDAVHQGSLEVHLELDPADIASSTALHSGIELQSLGYQLNTDFGTGGLLRATGSLQIDPVIDLSIDIGCDDTVFGVCAEIPDLNVHVEVGLNETANLSLEGDEDLEFDAEYGVATHNFEPITFFIGPVPVVLTPRLEIYLTAQGSLTATLSFEVDQEIGLAAGFEYNSDDGFSDLSRNDSSFDSSGVDFSGDVSAEVAAGARFEIRLYGVIGPYGSLEAGASLAASQEGLVGSGGTLWQLKGCLAGSVGISSVDVLDLDYEKELFDLCAAVASETNDPPTVVLAAPGPGTQIFVGEAVTLSALVDDRDGQTVSCDWESSRAGDSLPSGCEGKGTFGTTGSRTLTVTASDPTGETDTDSVTIEVEPLPDILVTITNPEDGTALGNGDPITLSGSASGGSGPYDYVWYLHHPTDDSGNGGDVYQIGTAASIEWGPNDTLGTIDCRTFDWARLELEATDENGFEGSRSVMITISNIC